MARATIQDVAKAAGVSTATVNRVLSGKSSVRQSTMSIVLDAAEEIGFYGTSVIKGRLAEKQSFTFAVLLLQSNRVFYRKLAADLKRAASLVSDCDIHINIHHLDDLSPDKVAQQMIEYGMKSDGLAVVAAQHPLVADAIETLSLNGVPVFGLITPLYADRPAGFIGIDNWKVGRTAAWIFDKTCHSAGKIAILVGSHRYRNQELNESGFRSYFREYNSAFKLLEPQSTYESSSRAREITENILREHSDLKGLFISGGGITGALAAIKESEATTDLVTVGYELMEPTRAALLDETLTVVISHPIREIARQTIDVMMHARHSNGETVNPSSMLPFEIYTRENM